jgi:rare lipoprotein A
MNKLHPLRWLTPAIVLVSGLGCASGSATSAPEGTPQTPTASDQQTIFAIAQPSTRPIEIHKTKPASTRPVAKATTPPRPKLPTTRPIVVAKPNKPAMPVEALAEVWDGKGKCEGVASFYAGHFLGRKTANGETYTGRKLTAAHRVLPFGTCVRVTNLENGLDVIVRINDRGPFVAGRVIDLSPAAAKKLHMTRQGVVKVKLETVAAWMAE